MEIPRIFGDKNDTLNKKSGEIYGRFCVVCRSIKNLPNRNVIKLQSKLLHIQGSNPSASLGRLDEMGISVSFIVHELNTIYQEIKDNFPLPSVLRMSEIIILQDLVMSKASSTQQIYDLRINAF